MQKTLIGMPTWVLIGLATSAGLLAVLFLVLIFLFFQCRHKKTQPSPASSCQITTSNAERIRPKIQNPIYTVQSNSIDKESNIVDTITTRKLSQMFDTRKKFSTAFSHRSAYFDFENSPLPKHKEYLDFNDIENMIPKTSRSVDNLASSSKPNMNLDGKSRKETINVKDMFSRDDLHFLNKSSRPPLSVK